MLRYDKFMQFLHMVNLSNNLYFPFKVVKKNEPQPTFTNYRFYVSKANNGSLVKHILKNKWWWSQSGSVSDESVNFCWTSLKQEAFFARQPKSTHSHEQVYKQTLESLEENVPSKEDTNSKVYQQLLNPHEQQLVGRLSTGTEDRNKRRLQMELQDTKHHTHKIDHHGLQQRVHNHLANNFHLGNKKALFHNMNNFMKAQGEDVSQYIPMTFHILDYKTDPEYQRFRQICLQQEEQSSSQTKAPLDFWIVKPGESTNRGQGIEVFETFSQIEQYISCHGVHKNGTPKTFIIQKYLSRPLLYQKRKFDIRAFLLVTSVNGCLKAFFYEEGYVRTSSYEYNCRNVRDKMVHLTNDAIQKQSDQYGRYEKGNKVSYAELQRHLDVAYKDKAIRIKEQVQPMMQHICQVAVHSVADRLDAKHEHNFEIFGLDFMLDENGKLFLIEINTNPDLSLCSSLLSRIIPQMLENSFKIALDPLFPPPYYHHNKKGSHNNYTLDSNKYTLIYDQTLHLPYIQPYLTAFDHKAVGEIIDSDEDN